MTTSKGPSGGDARTNDPPPTLLSLPKLPPLTEELRQRRREGAHIHYIPPNPAAAERERQARVAGLARLPSSRARRWFWQACTIADWYEGTHEMSEQALRRELDQTGEFSRWADFERETIQKPLAELHAHTDFRVHYEMQRRKGKVTAVRFHLAPARRTRMVRELLRRISHRRRTRALRGRHPSAARCAGGEEAPPEPTVDAIT